MRFARRLAGLLLAVALLAAGLAAATRPVAAASLPDFTATDLDGTPKQLSALRGRVTVVAFWATWCFPCRYELPLLERLYRERGDQGLRVVAVATDDELQAVREYVARQGFTFQVLYDRAGASRRGFGAEAVPATYLLDARGEPVPLVDPANGRRGTRLDNPLIWSDPATLERIGELLAAP